MSPAESLQKSILCSHLKCKCAEAIYTRLIHRFFTWLFYKKKITNFPETISKFVGIEEDRFRHPPVAVVRPYARKHNG